MRHAYERLRVHGAIRSALIGYGIAAYTLLFPQLAPAAGKMFLVGVALQVLVLIGRRLPVELAPLAVFVLELVADGITVLLFALATFRGIAERISGI